MSAPHDSAAPQRPDCLGSILVIDDEPDVVDLLCVYFSGCGYEVVGATQGADGLMLAHVHRPDVVLLDIMMPGIDGVQVLQQLRLRWPDLPVIMLTAVADVEVARSTLRRGAFDFIPKPFACEHVERVVAAAITARALA
jgi:DNA-binding response OmpR family regulator